MIASIPRSLLKSVVAPRRFAFTKSRISRLSTSQCKIPRQEAFHFKGVDFKSGDDKARFGELAGQRQSHIPQAQDAHFGGMPLQFILQRLERSHTFCGLYLIFVEYRTAASVFW